MSLPTDGIVSPLHAFAKASMTSVKCVESTTAWLQVTASTQPPSPRVVIRMLKRWPPPKMQPLPCSERKSLVQFLVYRPGDQLPASGAVREEHNDASNSDTMCSLRQSPQADCQFLRLPSSTGHQDLKVTYLWELFGLWPPITALRPLRHDFAAYKIGHKSSFVTGKLSRARGTLEQVPPAGWEGRWQAAWQSNCQR